jgi:MYXO-CTERM domain-containing protein
MKGLALVLALCSVGRAQEDVAVTPRQVVTLSESTTCPDVPVTHVPGLVRTSVGLAVHAGDGSYRFACASAFGGVPDGPTTASPDGAEVYFAAEGRLFRSADRGCTASEIVLEEGSTAIDLTFWRQAFWVLTATVEGGGKLLRWSGSELVEIAAWTTFRPDGMVVEDAEHLWVAGGLPQPDVRRLSFAGGLANDVPVAVLPTDLAEIERVVPVAAFDGEAWLRVERTVQVWTWQAEGDGDAGVTVIDTGTRHRSVLGPAMLDGIWYGVLDLALMSAFPKAGTWNPTGLQAPWTCLHGLGDRAFACTVPAMLAWEGFSDQGELVTTEVFRFDQVGSPELACGGIATCTTDWETWGGIAGITDAAEPAVCPDGRTASDLGPGGGCACAGGTGTGGLPAWLGLLVLVGLARRAGASEAAVRYGAKAGTGGRSSRDPG